MPNLPKCGPLHCSKSAWPLGHPRVSSRAFGKVIQELKSASTVCALSAHYRRFATNLSLAK